MKKVCKSFLLLAVMIFSISTFTFVYFTDSARAVSFEYDESTINSNMESMAQYFSQMSDVELDYFISNSIGVNKEALESMKAVKSTDIGDYVSVEQCKTKEHDDYLSADSVIHFKNKDVKMNVKFQYISQQVVPASVSFSIMSDDSKVSMGSKMATAGLNTLLGMGTVFVVLIFLSLIISLFILVPAIQNKRPAKKKEEPVKEEYVEEDEELVDDLELVAVITAAIAASENRQTDGFVVRSIKRSPQNRWKNA